MGTKRLSMAVAMVVATGLALIGMQPASAATDLFGYGVSAGGTRITAVGTTVSSDLTAESSVYAVNPASETNRVANVRVTSLAEVGAVDTSARGVAFENGFRTTAFARTLDVSLLDGLIRASAVRTTATAQVSSTTAGSASATTRVLDLVIGGRSYPADLPPNTGIHIPGVATVVVNYQQKAIEGESVVAQGIGLVVTLLKPRNGIAAGAEIYLNPTFTMIEPAKRNGGAQLGGLGYGAFIDANVGDEIHAKTGHLGAKHMPMVGTKGDTLSNTTGRVNVSGVLSASAIESTVTGVSSAALNEARVTSRLLDVRLFPNGLSSLISADAVGSVSYVRVDDSRAITRGSFQFVNLRIAGKLIPIDVAPNTQIKVANLGTVTLNKHTEWRYPGVVHAYQVIGLEIVLDTARAGLPVGAVIRVGLSQAIAYA